MTNRAAIALGAAFGALGCGAVGLAVGTILIMFALAATSGGHGDVGEIPANWSRLILFIPAALLAGFGGLAGGLTARLGKWALIVTVALGAAVAGGIDLLFLG